MGSASRYWQLVRLTGAGQRRVDEIAIAKTFFQQQFAELVDQSDVADPAIQRTLINLLRSPNTAALGDLAERCLRCLISHQIEQVCVQLAAKFGDRHGFTCTDLLPFVLDDGVQLMSQSLLQNQRQNNIPNQYRPLAAEILQTFDPNRASLNTWVMRQVRHHRELRAFLREHGVYLATDWGILNDTSPEQMRRIFTEFHRLSATEITLAYQLLRGYHEVYRSDRLQQRQQQIIRGKEACPPPTLDQLSRIAQFLQTQSITLSPPAILSSLQTIASQLRQYRLHRLGGALPNQSIDQSTLQAIEQQQAESDDTSSDEQEFLAFYRSQIKLCLDQALQQATDDRATYLQRKNTQTAQNFLLALQMLHCQGRSMTEIAPQIGLKAQFQVTRLLKLKEFRATVRSRLLQLLRDRILDKAKRYTDPAQLQALNQQIEAVLEEEVSGLLQSAEREAAVARQRPLVSLFARRLCHYLDIKNN